MEREFGIEGESALTRELTREFDDREDGIEHSTSDEQDGDVEDEEEWAAWEGLKGRPERWAPLGANDTDKEGSTSGSMEEK